MLSALTLVKLCGREIPIAPDQRRLGWSACAASSCRACTHTPHTPYPSHTQRSAVTLHSRVRSHRRTRSLSHACTHEPRSHVHPRLHHLILVESCPPSPTRGPHTNDSARADEATDLIPCAQIHPSMSVRHHNTPPDRESREHSAPATKAVGVYDPAIPVPRGPLCSCTLGAHAGIDQNPHLVLGAF